MIKQAFLFIILCLLANFSSSAQKSQRINAKLFYSLIQKHPKALVIDVRPSVKFGQYRIEGAAPAPEKKDLLELVKIVPKNDTLFIYCEKDIRTQPAAEILTNLGYVNIFELKGGLNSWRRNGLPLDREPFNK